MSSLLNRADLLHCLHHYPHFAAEHGDKFAKLLGLTLIEPIITKSIDSSKPAQLKARSKTALELSAAQSTTISVPLLQLTAYREFAEDDTQNELPELFADEQLKAYENNDIRLKAPAGLPIPRQADLMPWRRLWPFLKLALGDQVTSHKTDIQRSVNAIAKGECLRTLPKLRRKGWSAQAQLLIDYDDSLLPFREDFNSLWHNLAQLRGAFGLAVWAFPEGDPSLPCWRHTAKGWRTQQHYQLPEAGSPVLILSDLGCYDEDDHRRRRWRRFGKQLQATAGRAIAFMPCPPRYWDQELSSYFMPVYWDRAVRPPQRLSRRVQGAPAETMQRDYPTAERLIALLANAIRVEPAVLRVARFLFPPTEMDVSAEYAAWQHNAVTTSTLGFYFEAESAAHFREQFNNRTDLSEDIKQQVADMLHTYHAHLSPVIRFEEQLAHAASLGIEPNPEAVLFVRQLAKSVISDPESEFSIAAKQWLARLGERQLYHPELWQNEALTAAWVKTQITADNPEQTIPAGINLAQYAWLFAGKPLIKRQLVQQGQVLQFAEPGQTTGSLVKEFSFSAEKVQVQILADGEPGQSSLFTLSQPISFTPDQNLLIRTDKQELQLEWLTIPSWAEAFGRDHSGLYADLNLNGIQQRFRWITPGVFMMGSPETEAQRFSNETLYQGTLTTGYWLADTACTQALWQAVMGDNPSQFKDNPNNPVEMVSWLDTQVFIKKLNQLFPDLVARLPTEAEWEYACRAGTLTPFSFGENITPEQVNYDGNYPYNNAKKGEYRKRTLPVKSLPANPWGLHEMHGNVLEWCADWYSAYPDDMVIDPHGPPTGVSRVLRGGAWYFSARYCRSAYRIFIQPDDRNDFIGFRLALGQNGASSQEPATDSRRAVAGRTAPRQQRGQTGHSLPDSKRKNTKQKK